MTVILGEGHSNNSVVHMHDQRNEKKGLFLRLNMILGNRGQNVPIFKKQGPFWILLGALRGIFQMFQKQLCLGGKIKCKNHVKFLFSGGGLFGKGKS